MRINDTLSNYISIQQAQEKINHQQNSRTDEVNQKNSFQEVLNREITFSKHAGQRMAQRDIELSKQDIQKLGQAVKKAEEKGVRNTLVLFDQKAFIVNVPANIVITAMSGSDLKENIFTQIDGAVLL